MISLYQFPKPPSRHSFSPFCTKLESYLKIAKIPYENKFAVSVANSKKKKMPMILDQGQLIEDSGLIIDYLKTKYGVDLDKHLTAEQKAVAKAFQWLCEKSIVDIVIHFRWVDQANWKEFKKIVFAKAPLPVRTVIANVISKNIKKTLYKHGIGRFTDEEKLKILDTNLQAISDFLGSKTYFFGDQVSTIDTILHATLIQVTPGNIVPQFTGRLEKYPNLVQYVTNFSKNYWPELG